MIGGIAMAARPASIRRLRNPNVMLWFSNEPQRHRGHRDKTHREINRKEENQFGVYTCFLLRVFSSVSSVPLWFLLPILPVVSLDTRPARDPPLHPSAASDNQSASV